MTGFVQECGSGRALKAPGPDVLFAETFNSGGSALNKVLLNLENLHKPGAHLGGGLWAKTPSLNVYPLRYYMFANLMGN